MSSKTRSCKRNIAHEIMKREGIQHPNRRNDKTGERNYSRKYRFKRFRPISRRSYFAANWREVLRDNRITRPRRKKRRRRK